MKIACIPLRQFETEASAAPLETKEEKELGRCAQNCLNFKVKKEENDAVKEDVYGIIRNLLRKDEV